MPKIVDKEKRKKEIGIKAFEVFSRKGFESTTIQEIADAAGIGKGTVYEYFDTKEDMIRDVSIQFFNDMKQYIGAEVHENVNAAVKLRTFITESLKLIPEMDIVIPVYMEIWQNNIRGKYPELKKFFNSILEEFRQVIVSILDEGKKTGLFRKDIDSEALAIYLAASMDGIWLHYSYDKSRFDISRVTEYFFESFLKCLVTTNPRKKSIRR